VGINTVSTQVPGLYYRELKRGRNYFIDRYVDGERLYYPIGRVSYADAKVVYNTEVKRHQDCVPAVSQTTRSLTVKQILSRYWAEHLGCRGEDGNYLIPSAKDRKYLLRTVGARLNELKFSDLTKATVEQYIRLREKDVVTRGKPSTKKDAAPRPAKPITRRTIKAELDALSAALTHGVDCEWLPHNPIAKHITIKLPPPEKIALYDEKDWGAHWKGIYDNACKGWDTVRPDAYKINRFALLVLYETGMRPIEAFRMQHSWWLELQPGCWVIRIPEWADRKNRRTRDVPVSDRLWRDARGIIMPGSDAVVLLSTLTGEMRTKYGIRKTFERAVERAGYTGLGYTVYSLRRFRASRWDEIDEGASMAALGHSPGDSHRKNYSTVSPLRLFALVGKKYKMKLTVISADKAESTETAVSATA
jgi:integrase